MSNSLILILDDRSDTELIIRRAFEASPILVRQVQTRQDALLIADEIEVLLISTALQSEDAYQLASDLTVYYPSAALYFLVSGEYDSDIASASGALGCFDYPLNPNLISNSLKPFLNTVFGAREHCETATSTLNFSHDTVDMMDNSLVNAQFEALIKLQLLTNVDIRRVVRQLVKEFINEENSST